MKLVKNMKIVSYKKKKSNIYELSLDDKTKLNLYDDVILKYELLLKKEITQNNLKEIIKFNSFLESYYIALKFINSKLRTEKEIIKKLNNFSKDAINYTLDRLKKEGYLNDEVYIKAYINDAINLKMIGPNKIIFELKKLGFKEEKIFLYLETIEDSIWLQKIEKYINKKINSNHNLSGIVLKQKIIHELQNKGFTQNLISLIINEYPFEDSDEIYHKEYEKLKNKLSRKYSKEELEYRIKINLMKKGFKKVD